MRQGSSMQSNEEMEAIVKACSDAGVQFMDGMHAIACSLSRSASPVNWSWDSLQTCSAIGILL